MTSSNATKTTLITFFWGAVAVVVGLVLIVLVLWFYETGGHGRTWLHDAAQRDDAEAIHRLVRFGWNVNATLTEPCLLEQCGFSGITPLMIAALRGHYSAAKALVDEGADIYLVATMNRDITWLTVVRTAFDDAVGGGNPRIVRLLWEKSNKKAFRNASITPALERMCVDRDKGNVTEMVEFLVDNVVDKPTWVAAAGEILERPKCSAQVALLVAHGFAPTPSAMAVVSARGTPAVLAQLLARGGDVNAKGNSGVTPLFAAAVARNAGTVRMLLDSGADPNIVGGWFEQTPLVAVVAGGGPAVGDVTEDLNPHQSRSEIVGLLLKHGARTDIRDKQGKTVFDYLDRLGSPSTNPWTPSERDEVEAMLHGKSIERPTGINSPRAIGR
jgi:ankyrin repeat protein